MSILSMERNAEFGVFGGCLNRIDADADGSANNVETVGAQFIAP